MPVTTRDSVTVQFSVSDTVAVYVPELNVKIPVEFSMDTSGMEYV